MTEYPKYKYLDYAIDVMEGKIIVGEWVFKAVERFLGWFGMEDRYYDEKAVERVINFIQKLRHFKGASAHKQFILEPWQINFIAMVYGFKWKHNGLRICREALLEVARKNGKSAFAAALLCYSILEESGAEVYCIANNAKQAGLVFEVCAAFIEGIDPKQKYFKRYRDTIKFLKAKSKLRVLASDTTNGALDGLNPNFAVIDEGHGLRDSAIPSVFRSAVMNREQPILLYTSTAGFNMYGFLYEFEQECKQVIQGVIKDESLTALIYTLDEGDDWRDEKNWIKANPNLGVSVRYDALKREIDNAIQTPTKENDMKVKNLNMWVQAIDTWIPQDYILNTMKEIKIDFFKDKFVWCGVDLSAVSDITALAIMLPPTDEDDKYYFKINYYLPKTCLDSGVNSSLYRKWYNEGFIHLTNSDVVDYDAVTKDLIELTEKEGAYVNKIAYDAWNSVSWACDCEERGLPIAEFSQSIGSFNRCTKEFERLMLQQRIVLDNNPITLWMISNCQLKTDHNNNQKPIKKGADNGNAKIDGVIAALECLGAYLLEPKYHNIIYSV